MIPDHDRLPEPDTAEPGTAAKCHAEARASAGFVASRGGGFILVTPLDASAHRWLHDHIDGDATWSGETLIVERCFLPQLAEAIAAAGYRIGEDV